MLLNIYRVLVAVGREDMALQGCMFMSKMSYWHHDLVLVTVQPSYLMENDEAEEAGCGDTNR